MQDNADTAAPTYCGQWAWKELQAPDFLPVGQRHLWPATPAPVCHEHAAELEAQGVELVDAHPDKTPLRCMVIVQHNDGFGTGPLCEEDPDVEGRCAYHRVQHNDGSAES